MKTFAAAAAFCLAALPLAAQTPTVPPGPTPFIAPAQEGPPQPVQATVTLPPEIARVLTDYESAWQAKDANALALLFTPDGMVLATGRAPIRGREAIEEAYRGRGGALSLRGFAFAMDGSVGWILGGFTRTPGEADVGKFTMALRKGKDGRWLIALDTDSPNFRSR